MITNLHKPIMVDEILSFIQGEKELSILDCTFGGGGHTQKFLDKSHYVTAIDQDKNAINSAEELSKRNSKLSFYKINFKDLDKIDEEKIHNKFNLILQKRMRSWIQSMMASPRGSLRETTTSMAPPSRSCPLTRRTSR